MNVKNISLVDASEDKKRALVHEHRNSCKTILKTIGNINLVSATKSISRNIDLNVNQTLPNKELETMLLNENTSST